MSLLQWKALLILYSTVHLVPHLDIHKNSSLQNRFAMHKDLDLPDQLNWLLWMCLMLVWVRVDSHWFIRISGNSPVQPVLTWRWSVSLFWPTSTTHHSFHETMVSGSTSKCKVLPFLQTSQLLTQQGEFRELSQRTLCQNLIESYVMNG